MKLSQRQKGIFALIFLTLVFASMGLFARYLNTGFKLFQQVYLRVLAAFFLGLLLFSKDLNFNKLKRISKKEWLLLIVRSTSSYLLGVTLFTNAIILTKYSNVSFIGALPLSAVFGFILLKEKFTYKKVLFISLAFLGSIFILVKDYSHIFDWGIGEIFALLSAIFFSFGYITRRWHSNLLNNKEITQLTFFISFILIFLFSLTSGEGIPISSLFTLNMVLVILGAGLFNVINLFLSNYGFQKVEAVLASNILTMESFFAVFLGFLFYREIPILKELLGGILIVISVIQMNRLEVEEKS